MSTPKKGKKLPKDVEQLTDAEVIQAIFGKRGHAELKRSADPNPQDTEADDSPTVAT